MFIDWLPNLCIKLQPFSKQENFSGSFFKTEKNCVTIIKLIFILKNAFSPHPHFILCLHYYCQYKCLALMTKPNTLSDRSPFAVIVFLCHYSAQGLSFMSEFNFLPASFSISYSIHVFQTTSYFSPTPFCTE